ncbi:DUF1330 domain-containing protein [Goodfellowiella coeruleoviolacea]|uniref:Uncharacterized conserved protein, DUF1330 family n=1 Tax=Goodfellowiella coeruleoviolacea TaxID=334858 RepID=A0AAE3GBT6_9PSEU|nr:DUF1330 domain-containing protein [Goodfellowiella coeruleoviolacea]MCP2165346.1 Uncharacterized conserved protein, DUF1330 family [Goodfellowiella coeruleoviolacea]
MPAYVFVDSEVLDEERAREYRVLAEASIAAHGGRYLVRGQVPEVVEGAWPAPRVITVLEFPDRDRAHAWYASPEYERARVARQGAIELRLLVVEGTRP